MHSSKSSHKGGEMVYQVRWSSRSPKIVAPEGVAIEAIAGGRLGDGVELIKVPRDEEDYSKVGLNEIGRGAKLYASIVSCVLCYTRFAGGDWLVAHISGKGSEEIFDRFIKFSRGGSAHLIGGARVGESLLDTTVAHLRARGVEPIVEDIKGQWRRKVFFGKSSKVEVYRARSSRA